MMAGMVRGGWKIRMSERLEAWRVPIRCSCENWVRANSAIGVAGGQREEGTLCSRGPPVAAILMLMARAPRRGEDEDGPLDEDLDRFSGATQACPKCGTELHDDVELCWKCGHALGAEVDQKGLPKWVLVTVGVVLLAMLAWMMRGVVA